MVGHKPKYPDDGASWIKITKVITIDPKREMDVCTKFHGNQFNSYWDILLKTSYFIVELKYHRVPQKGNPSRLLGYDSVCTKGVDQLTGWHCQKKAASSFVDEMNKNNVWCTLTRNSHQQQLTVLATAFEWHQWAWLQKSFNLAWNLICQTERTGIVLLCFFPFVL